MQASFPDLERSDSTRDRAERALVWLLHELGENAPEIVLLGGLVPGILTSGQVPPVPRHLGTTDVDVLLITHLEMAEDPRGAEVEKALTAMGFSPEAEGWCWRGPVEDVIVRIEFLCDVNERETGALVPIQGCSTLAALNLRGTRYVGMDFEEHEISSLDADGNPVSVKVRVAGLAGYLLAKACALRNRALTKDYYDFAYVLIHNRAGGPAEAARLIKEGSLARELPSLRSVLVEVRARYTKTSDNGPSRFAEESQRVDTALDAPRARADAVTAVTLFMAELDI